MVRTSRGWEVVVPNVYIATYLLLLGQGFAPSTAVRMVIVADEYIPHQYWCELGDTHDRAPDLFDEAIAIRAWGGSYMRAKMMGIQRAAALAAERRDLRLALSLPWSGRCKRLIMTEMLALLENGVVATMLENERLANAPHNSLEELCRNGRLALQRCGDEVIPFCPGLPARQRVFHDISFMDVPRQRVARPVRWQSLLNHGHWTCLIYAGDLLLAHTLTQWCQQQMLVLRAQSPSAT
jgi:hypothetical protein